MHSAGAHQGHNANKSSDRHRHASKGEECCRQQRRAGDRLVVPVTTSHDQSAEPQPSQWPLYTLAILLVTQSESKFQCRREGLRFLTSNIEEESILCGASLATSLAYVMYEWVSNGICVSPRSCCHLFLVYIRKSSHSITSVITLFRLVAQASATAPRPNHPPRDSAASILQTQVRQHSAH